MTFQIHCGPKREVIHQTNDVNEAIQESLKLSEVKDISVGNEPPTEALKGKSWKMVQVWVKCPRVVNSLTTCGSSEQQTLVNKKLRGRPHGTTIAKREKNEIKDFTKNSRETNKVKI